jgi:hypothetical protein
LPVIDTTPADIQQKLPGWAGFLTWTQVASVLLPVISTL